LKESSTAAAAAAEQQLLCQPMLGRFLVTHHSTTTIGPTSYNGILFIIKARTKYNKYQQ